MSKPIEWTREVKSTETTLIRTRLAVQQMDRYGSTIAVLAATPADLIAALAAMPAEEREKVLRELDAGPPTAPSWLSDAAEALGEVRPEDGAPLALNWTQVVRAIYDQRAERDNWRARAEKAERERDEAHSELSRLRAKPPRSYPLAEGSRWIENVIRSADGSQSWLSDGQVVTDGPFTGALRYTYRQPARDLAALLAKGGLL
jgi:hypothetical protein